MQYSVDMILYLHRKTLIKYSKGHSMINPFYDFKRARFNELELQLGISSRLIGCTVYNEKDLVDQVGIIADQLAFNPLMKLLGEIKDVDPTKLVNMALFDATKKQVVADIIGRASDKEVYIFGDSATVRAAFDRIAIDTMFLYGSGVVATNEKIKKTYTSESKLSPVYKVSVDTRINYQKWLVHTKDGELDLDCPTLFNGEKVVLDDYGLLAGMKETMEIMSVLKAKGCIGYDHSVRLMELDGLVAKAERIAEVIGGTAKDRIILAQSLNSGEIKKTNARKWLMSDYDCTAKKSNAICAIFSDRLTK